MTNKIIALLLCNAIAQNVAAQNDRTRMAHIGLVYPISTNGKDAKQYTNNGSFHAIAGVSAAENAFCISGVANMITHNADGFILAGVHNQIGKNASGLQLSGFSNFIKGNAQGLQLAGFVNIVKDTGKGVQLAGFSNISRYSNNQIAGFCNVAKETEGTQISGFTNVSKKINGLQITGFANVAKDVEGVQIAGFINVAQKVKGVQVAGFINIADSCEYPLGLVNIIKNGEQYIGATFDETGTALLSFRSGSKRMYGILGAGFNVSDKSLRYGLEGGVGMHIPLSPWFRFKTEFTVLSLTDFTDGVLLKSSLRILPSVRLGRCFEVFAGPSFGFSNHPDYLGDQLHLHYVWSRKSNGTFYGLNIGGMAGLQLRL